MSKSQNRKAAFLVLAAVSLSFVGLAGPAAGAPTLDITGLRISPNPGYACENTTIRFNVTNNLGTMVDLVDVHVDAKGSAGGMSWQSNITMFADRATSFQSFTWINPPEGTYDLSITVIGAGQIAQKSGVYTVLPCAAHVYIGHVTIVKSALSPDSATLTAEVRNDGHLQANNTMVAVQATGPHPDKTRYFLGSTMVPAIAAGGSSHPDFMWAPLPAPGVYTVTVMTIDETGVMMSEDVSLVVDLQPRPSTVRITGISVDPWPPMQGQESTVTAELMFTGNWTGVPVTVLAYADGPSSYKLYNITLKEILVTGVMAVNFTWPATIEPGQYDLTVTASMFNPREYTISKIAVTQLAKQKQWSPANFRLKISDLRMGPYPPLPGQNSTITVEVANTGDADAPPAQLTVTAEGPAFYNLGTRTTPNTSFGTMVRMAFNWTQPIVPGEYTIRAFLEDAGGNQSELRKTYPMPHVLESNLSVVNGSAVYNYYYYGVAPNGTSGQNITVVVPATLNETEAASTGLDTVTTGAIVGIAIGSVVSVASMAAYMLGKHKGQMGTVQSNPMYQDKTNAGQNPMYQDKGMAGESPLHIHERMVHGVHRGEGVDEPQEASLVGGALPGGAVISSAVSSGVRESPTRPSTGQTAVRESPSRPSTGQTSIRESPTQPSTGPTSERKSKVAAIGRVETPLGLQGTRESPTLASTGVKPPRDAASGLATGRRQYEPVTVTDEDGDAGSDARMAINEKGLPGKKKPSTQRLAGDGTEPMDDDSDDDGLSDADERKGWDGTVKGVKVDEGEAAYASKKGYDYYQAQSQLNSAGKVRESPTRASNASTRDSVSSVAQTAGSGGDDMPTESLDQSRKGWDGVVKGVKVDEAGPEAASKKGYDYYQARSDTNAAGKVRESPTRATAASTRDSVSSVAQTAGSSPAGEPMGIRESPTRASGLRESPTQPSKGQTSVRESPAQASDFAIKEQGVKSSQAAPPTGDLDGDGAPELRGGGYGTTRSNRWENPKAAGGSGADLDRDGAPDIAAKEEGGRHTPFHNKLAPEEAAGVDGIKGHRDVGGYRAAEATEGSGGGTRAQDHNSVRSNKTASVAAPEGGGSSGDGQIGDLARKGWDGTVKGSTKADEAPEGTNASNPIPGVGIVVKHNPPTPPKTK